MKISKPLKNVSIFSWNSALPHFSLAGVRDICFMNLADLPQGLKQAFVRAAFAIMLQGATGI